LQNAAHDRLFAADAVELDAQRLGGVVVPLFEVAAEQNLAADAHRYPEPLADFGHRLAALYGRVFSRQDACGEDQGD
jgi:hypothetical protein